MIISVFGIYKHSKMDEANRLREITKVLKLNKKASSA